MGQGAVSGREAQEQEGETSIVLEPPSLTLLSTALPHCPESALSIQRQLHPILIPTLWGHTQHTSTYCGPKHRQFSSVQLFSCVGIFAIPWIAACQAPLSITNPRSLLKLMSIELVMLSNHLILCHPFLFLLSTFPSIRVFPNESVLHQKWPKYWSFSFQ